MKFEIVEKKTFKIGALCNDLKTANKIKNDFYKADLKLYNKSNGYLILLNEEDKK